MILENLVFFRSAPSPTSEDLVSFGGGGGRYIFSQFTPRKGYVKLVFSNCKLLGCKPLFLRKNRRSKINLKKSCFFMMIFVIMDGWNRDLIWLFEACKHSSRFETQVNTTTDGAIQHICHAPPSSRVDF